MQAILPRYKQTVQPVEIGVPWFWAGLYFFFNTWLLPLGLLYTTILTPLLLIYLHKHKALRYVVPFFLLTLPFAVVQLYYGVAVIAYFISWSLLFSVYVFALALYRFVRDNRISTLFRWVLTFNFILLLIALLLRFSMPATTEWFWYQNKITTGAAESIRYKALTYEASYYALLLAPVFLYYLLRLLLTPVKNKGWLLLLTVVPLLLSLSFGVMGALLFALILALCADAQAFIRAAKYLRWVLLGAVAGFIILIMFVRWLPDSAVALRMINILQGQDPSFTGRTTDAFYLAWQIAKQKSIWWGAGFGQVKVLGPQIFQQYYSWPAPDSHAVALPNSVADLLAQAGLIGVLIKFLLCGFFFFKTATYNNVYRLSLFAFLFIYQFTGSFINNVAEFSIWVLCFSPGLFSHFDRENVAIKDSQKNTML